MMTVFQAVLNAMVIPIKILKGCQKTIIVAYNDLMNDKEIEVIKEMVVPSKRDLETFCRI